jgi:hypothetical protein
MPIALCVVVHAPQIPNDNPEFTYTYVTPPLRMFVSPPPGSKGQTTLLFGCPNPTPTSTHCFAKMFVRVVVQHTPACAPSYASDDEHGDDDDSQRGPGV